MTNKPILISAGGLESQFTFFYNLKARILSCNPPKKNNELLETKKTFGVFEWREIKPSYLSRFFYSDDFPVNIIAAHLHGTMAAQEEREVSITIKQTPYSFEFPTNPPGLTNIDGYAHIECTVYNNGMLALVVRLVNTTDISDEHYVESIKRPEYGREAAARAVGESPGQLIKEVWRIVDKIEPKLAECLNILCFRGITLSAGAEKTLEFYSQDDPNWLEPGSEKEQDKIACRLVRSRPYVGTVIYFGDSNTEAIGDRLARFAIACGRTTPELLDTFLEPQEYLKTGTPSRNVYHPGNSIVFIARRGWACFEIEARDKPSFHLGVVEVVTHSVQATIASARATRWVVAQILREGNRADLGLMTALDRSGIGHRIKPWQILFPTRSEEIIREFTEFLTRARIISPFDDLNILLPSHLTTHTGIAAVERIRQLTMHRELIEDARRTVANYGASLEGANQYWAMQNMRAVRISLSLAILAFLAAAFAIALNISGGASP